MDSTKSHNLRSVARDVLRESVPDDGARSVILRPKKTLKDLTIASTLDNFIGADEESARLLRLRKTQTARRFAVLKVGCADLQDFFRSLRNRAEIASRRTLSNHY